MRRTLLVIPHYRDSRRLKPFLADLLRVLPQEFGILVSDDGSGPEGVGALKDLLAGVESGPRSLGAILLEPVLAAVNSGKGGAVYAGWRAGFENFGDSYWQILGFVDADGAVSASEILRAARYFAERNDAIDGLIGSRVKMLGRVVDRKVSRHISGRIFATIVSMVAGLRTYDSQCGFKLFNREVVATIMPHARCFGFSFDVEMLLLVERFGFRIEEFPVDWRDVAGGKVNLLRDPLPMLMQVWKARSGVDKLRIEKVDRSKID